MAHAPSSLSSPFTSSPAPGAATKAAVPDAFDGAARAYDLLTGLNPGYRKHLRWSAERLGARPDGELLDLCCGTGLSTRALVDAYPRARVTGLDASAGMLAVARRKAGLRGVTLVEGNAMDPAAAGARGPYDGILMAYGIRNVPDADACLAKLRELLAPGAPICFHEYSVADSRRSRLVWNAVAMGIILPTASLAGNSTELYKYLRESVLAFDGVTAFEARLRRAGFVDVRTEPMDGWQRGIVHSFLARRPR
jgi:ubiquinone/menaquinone biosynthesis C-methylase UbiE